ncbi:ATP synthase F1 subunit epsilon [Amaricoccus solimangrovi]|uniref:ATP synthase epsilon chain n=2 Tax=Amaricoccus solimangrovi TaxID=2589815 RepID=A0A501X0X1_9RHOB|nr:ATP synthase F1 subunit epsilon [Amaricoccus solimangrovi]
MHFDLVSPERKVVSVEASMVQIPGADGDLTAMPNHAPFLTTLRPGVVKVTAAGQVSEYVVTGGFAEVSPTATSILAEQAMPREEVTADLLDQLQKSAEAALAETSGDEEKGAADTRLRDIAQLKRTLRL